MAKVLVTGGKGFLGSHLAAKLAKTEDQVRIFSRQKGTNSSILRDSNYEFSWGDIRDSRAVENAVEGVDYIIHTVSNFRKGGSDKDDAYSTNVEGTENILRAAEKHNVQHIIHCSTIGVHGTVLEIPANEDTPFNPTDLYQETKLIAEKKVWEFYQKTKLPITVIRPISLFGAGDMRMLKLFRLIKQGKFIIVGDGEVLFHPAYIDDVVQGFLLCLGNERAFGEAFIIGGEGYLTLNELCGLIAEELKVRPPKLYVPMVPVLALATLCEKICVPLGIEPPLHRRRVSFFQNNRAFSIDKAKQILGYQPQFSLEEGIQKTIQWYQAQGWL
ncbi:putative NAD-dependent epimerase [Halomicronema hongdechloris C2206]|uniref:NAD-dependent epimerase n=1 Tax=Halomicronema hongdechloris C2206 TaxID=1641165 RepID=A0A1V8NK16_9CYAN|nr:NAD(P)-dependent oxidoreductase [Halomicronema hongdechloris]ASC73185.1 putative NAD-dependent epimerase [Halomicronema hongdechloris C2206]